MRPPLWQPPIELSTAEHAIMKRIRRAKLFVSHSIAFSGNALSRSPHS